LLSYLILLNTCFVSFICMSCNYWLFNLCLHFTCLYCFLLLICICVHFPFRMIGLTVYVARYGDRYAGWMVWVYLYAECWWCDACVVLRSLLCIDCCSGYETLCEVILRPVNSEEWIFWRLLWGVPCMYLSSFVLHTHFAVLQSEPCADTATGKCICSSLSNSCPLNCKYLIALDLHLSECASAWTLLYPRSYVSMVNFDTYWICSLFFILDLFLFHTVILLLLLELLTVHYLRLCLFTPML
jgi:hypothetical protein